MEADIETVDMAEGTQSSEFDEESVFQTSATMETCDVDPDDGERESSSFPDAYNFNLCVSVTETNTEEVDAEFCDALEEIAGQKSFPCTQCDKICKSKGGLTRHTNSKHGDGGEDVINAPVLCPESVSVLVETIKAKIIKENFYGDTINASVKAISSTLALCNALSPLYKTYCHKKDQDKFLESFYGLMLKSTELLVCQDSRVANLIMIHLPEHLIAFSHSSQSTDKQYKSCQLDPSEQGPLSYMAGYVIAKLMQLNRNKSGKEELQALLMSMKSAESNSYIAARSRGGLVTPCNDLVRILEAAEISFREHVDRSSDVLRNIPVELITNSVLNSPIVISLWDNIILSCELQPSSSIRKLCLENIIKLYLKVRSFSCARDYISRYRIKAKQLAGKALRKELKKN
jgi:hypothetical protein